MSALFRFLTPPPVVTTTRRRPLGIAAAGLCCAVGYHLRAAHCALRANMDHFQESAFRSRSGEPILVARLPEANLWGQRRMARWLALALEDCLLDAPELDTASVPLVWIAPEPARGGPDAQWWAPVFEHACAQLGRRFHPESTALVAGRAGLAAALAHCDTLMHEGGHSHVLLAGVDSYLDGATIERYLGTERLQIPGNSDGFIPGEAAAALLLDRAPKGRPGVRIAGYGEGQEEGRPDGSVPSRAQGLTAAIRNALSAAGSDYADLQFRLSDQNGEAFFAREASNAMTRVAPVGGQRLELLTLADCLGEIGAATGPAMLAYLSRHLAHHSAPGHRGLLHLANDDGRRAAAIVHYQHP